MSQLENWALNLHWLIGFLTCLGIILILGVVAWTGVKIWLLRNRQQRAQRQRCEQTHWPAGRPRPPMGEGMCDACQRACSAVYYLPTGRRLCPECYDGAG